jgi:uncharacterized OB-fold protein
MSEPRFPDEPLFVPAELELRYRYGAGREASHYLKGLKENMAFEGTHCPKCQRVYLPPRPVCGICYVECDGWVPVGPEGTITGATVVEVPFVDPITGEQRPVPYGFAFILLDGASTNIFHFVDETVRTKLAVGMRVRPRFRAERTGSITDVEGFDLIREAGA